MLQKPNKQNTSNKEIIQWAEKAATDTMTFNYLNYKDNFKLHSQYFKPDGWTTFEGALQNSRVIETITKYEQFVETTIGNFFEPSMQIKEDNGNQKKWMVVLPLDIKFTDSSNKRRFSKWKTVLIIEENNSTTGENDNLNISQWIATSASP